MSAPPRIDRGQARQFTGNHIQDALQTQQFEAFRRLSRHVLATAVPVFGEKDTSKAGGLTDGVSFTAGQTKDVFHGLGRTPIGFIVIDVQTNAQALKRVTIDDAQLSKTHIRLTHTGASTTAVKLLVF